MLKYIGNYNVEEQGVVYDGDTEYVKVVFKNLKRVKI